jgi:hypothetical protein
MIHLIKWIPYHHRTMHPQFTDGIVSFKIYKAPGDGHLTRCGCSALDQQRITMKTTCYELSQTASDLDGFFGKGLTNGLS